MKKLFLFAFALLSTATSFAAGHHTGYCRYGEECGGIVSQNLREAQRICAREVYDYLALAVRQQQRDGSVIFIGYTCVAPPGGY